MTETNQPQNGVPASTPAQNTGAETAVVVKPAIPPEIKANFDSTTDFKEVRFNFRINKELGQKRASVDLELPVPSVEGIIKILQEGDTKPKALALLLEAVAEVVLTQARDIVNDKEDIDAANFPYDKISWTAISELPKSERRGGGIPKEVWEAFAADYITSMQSIANKSVDQVTNASKIFLNKFSAVKDRKPVLAMLKTQLGMYVESAPNAEQFQECVEFLINKADSLLKLTEAELLANL